MSNGVFGTVRPANLNPSSDVEILYRYMPSRGETGTNYQYLNVSNLIAQTGESDGSTFSINGLYNLRLPLNIFNKKGIYNIYIRPKEHRINIHDVSILAAYPDVKGIVLNLTDISGINDLTGYRIEFSDGTTRLIKSCNRCAPVTVNTGDGTLKMTRYNLVDNSSDLVFCTVTPSTSPSFKPNANPYIGQIGEMITIANTLFTPQLYTIEMVEHDAETLSYMLEGDQANDRDNAIITTYNNNKEIYHQSDYYVLKDKLGKPLYNIRKKRENIDTNQNYDNIIG